MRYVLIILLSLLAGTNAMAIATDTTGGKSAPAKVSGDVQTLVNYLCDAMAEDTVKANLIYNWITSNIAYDIKAAKDPDRGAPVVQDILKDKKATQEGYTLLFQEMCKAVGLEVVRIQGYAKDWKFDNGDKYYVTSHEWCAVMVGRRWELVDPTFGAGYIKRTPGWLRTQLNKLGKEKIEYAKKEAFEFRYAPEYFLVNPLLFRYTHLPADPLWQLCKTPMPLNVFEAGDSAIAYYNDENPGRINRSAELEYIARLNPDQQLSEYADRAYKFNRRFDLVLAMKEQANAAALVKKYASRRGIPPKRSYEDAYRGMVLADGYIKKQKSYIPDHYAALKKKNTTKNKEAGDYVRKIRTHNKALVAKCRMQATSAERKKKNLDSKLDKVTYVLEHISPLRIDSIKTSTVQKDKNSPQLRALADSIKAKESRLKKMNMQMIDKIQGLTMLQEENKTLFHALTENHLLGDTALIYQAEARINFRDVYDDEMRLYMDAFNKSRFILGDTMQKRYNKNFDTLAVYYDELMKTYQQQADVYKATLRDMEQYRKQNNTEDFILSSYSSACNGYTQCMSQYKETMEVYLKFLEENSKTFTERAGIYENETDILDRMDEAEAARKEAEDVALNEQKVFDERQLEKQQQNITTMQEQLTEILSK